MKKILDQLKSKRNATLVALERTESVLADAISYADTERAEQNELLAELEAAIAKLEA